MRKPKKQNSRFLLCLSKYAQRPALAVTRSDFKVGKVLSTNAELETESYCSSGAIDNLVKRQFYGPIKSLIVSKGYLPAQD